MKQPYEMNLNYIEKKDEWLKNVDLLQMKYRGMTIHKISRITGVPPDQIEKQIIILNSYRYRSGVF